MSAPNQPLCDICQQKPRHGSFPYCGKTCANKASASKASTLCNHCYSKPKFPPFDFCGKKCAASANSKPNNGVPQPLVQANTGVPAPALNARANGYSKNLPPKPYAAPLPHVASQLPPAQTPQAPAALRALNSHQPSTNAGANVATSVLQSVKQALSGPQQQPAKMQPNYAQVNGRGQYVSAPGAPSLDCLIPGCGKPVHLDENGIPASDYCSQRHREQAVNSGIVSPCIMCLNLPQGDADHFCSRLCREEALSKPF